MTENTSSITPIEAINEFYRLKNKYESEYHEKYVKQIIKSQKSKREKRVEYSKLPKHECINCKRNVGTLFQIKFDDTNHLRKFTAKCGDIQNPCPLDILIEYNYREKLKQEETMAMTGPLSQNSGAEGPIDLNTALAELIAISKRTADLNEKQLSVQSSLSGDLFA